MTTPQTYGLTKIAYSERELVKLVPIGRTSLFCMEQRGELTPVRLGRKKIYLATDIAALFDRLRDPDAPRT
jgi:hypothetical protein